MLNAISTQEVGQLHHRATSNRRVASQIWKARETEAASALTVEAKYDSHPFAGGQPPMTILLFVSGSKGEARAHREKLSKAKPRDLKGVVCRGLP